MKHTSLGTLLCPVARSLDHVGEWWSILILRDALTGLTRFDEFQQSLGIATSTLSVRLNALVASGLLVKQQYCEKPPRDEYILTETGLDFEKVILAFTTWGNDHFAEEGHSTEIIDTQTQRPVRLGLVDLNTGEAITRERHTTAAGPAASERMRYRFDYAARRRADPDFALTFAMPPRPGD